MLQLMLDVELLPNQINQNYKTSLKASEFYVTGRYNVTLT